MSQFGDKVSFIRFVADLLRGPYRPPRYGRVILPLVGAEVARLDEAVMALLREVVG